MKGRTAFRLAVIGAVLYAAYCAKKSGSLDDGSESRAELEQLKKDLEEDIKRAKLKAAEDAPGTDQDGPDEILNDDIGPVPVGLADPYKEYTEAEFRAMCPKELNYTDIAEDSPIFYAIDGDKPLYGIRLRDADCIEYDFRIQHGRGDADISGMYYDWNQEIKYPENKPECTVYLNESGQGICLWKDRSYRYSLAVKEGASLVTLVWMRKRIMAV